MGRFSSEDPARAGLNWYTYCVNNPVMYVDPTGLDCWVFYDENNFSEQALSEAERLELEYGTEAHLIPIGSFEDFLLNWEYMVENDTAIDGVSLVFHGTEYTLYFGEDDIQLTSSIYNKTPLGNEGYYVGDLTKATMKSLNLMLCNGGHLDHIYANDKMHEKGIYHNIAVEFLLTHDVKTVYGMDGNLAYTKIFNYYAPRLSYNQDSFKEKAGKRKYFGFLGKRKPLGKILYFKNSEGGIVWCPIWR